MAPDLHVASRLQMLSPNRPSRNILSSTPTTTSILPACLPAWLVDEADPRLPPPLCRYHGYRPAQQPRVPWPEPPAWHLRHHCLQSTAVQCRAHPHIHRPFGFRLCCHVLPNRMDCPQLLEGRLEGHRHVKEDKEGDTRVCWCPLRRRLPLHRNRFHPIRLLQRYSRCHQRRWQPRCRPAS